MDDERRRARLIAYYQRQADYWGKLATFAAQQYLDSGRRVDLTWFRSLIATHLRYTGHVRRLLNA